MSGEKGKRESDLAKELGLPRKELREIRSALGVDLWMKEGNTIMISPQGEHKIRNEIQKRLSAEDLGDRLEVPLEKEFTITGIPRNTKLLICGDTRVRVTNNQNFLVGMKVKAREPAKGELVWSMYGRCPRWRGRW